MVRTSNSTYVLKAIFTYVEFQVTYLELLVRTYNFEFVLTASSTYVNTNIFTFQWLSHVMRGESLIQRLTIK